MSHEFESGVFVGQPAWHGLGTVVQTAPTTLQAMQLAGMDWQVVESDLAEAPGWKRLNRSDTGQLLHVCRKSWTPIQNQEAFAWFDPLIQDGDVGLETAVSLVNGKRIAILAKIRDSKQEVVPGDEVEQYLLLHNSHDASLGLGVKFTNVRVVCQNTLSAATVQGQSHWQGESETSWSEKWVRVRHTTHVERNLTTVRDAIDIHRRRFEKTVAEYRLMASTPMNLEGFRLYVGRVFRKELEERQRSDELGERGVEELRYYCQLEENFQAGVGMGITGVSGTVWAGFQAVSEFVTHQRGQSQGSRLNSQWFGDGQRLLLNAYREAIALTRS